MAEVQRQFNDIKLTVPWGHIAARTYGSSIGEPVLMVHGRLDNSGSFTRLIKYLPMNLFYYVCVDLPGHGWSSHLPSWLSLDILTYTNTLHYILEALQWERCIYIGHSMGAQIGMMLSVLEPHRIKKLICFDSFLHNIALEEDHFIKYIKKGFALSIKASSNIKPPSYTKEEILYALKNLRFAKLNSEAADALFERAVTEVENGKYIYNRDVRLKNDPFSFLNNDNFYSFLRNFSVPIYIISVSDGFISQNKESFISATKSLNPKLLEVFYINGNHDVHNNNPEEVGPIICNILNSHGSSKL